MKTTFGAVRLTNRDYQAKGPTDSFEGTNTHCKEERHLNINIFPQEYNVKGPNSEVPTLIKPRKQLPNDNT